MAGSYAIYIVRLAGNLSKCFAALAEMMLISAPESRRNRCPSLSWRVGSQDVVVTSSLAVAVFANLIRFGLCDLRCGLLEGCLDLSALGCRVRPFEDWDRERSDRDRERSCHSRLLLHCDCDRECCCIVIAIGNVIAG